MSERGPAREEYESYAKTWRDPTYDNDRASIDLVRNMLAVADAALAEADGRIAHLAAENENMAWLLKSYRVDYVPKFVEDGLKARAEKAEAAVERLRARRCDGCREWLPYPVQEAFGPRMGSCGAGVILPDDGVPAEFACKDWAERGGEK